MTPKVHAFFDEATNTITYLVREPHGRACAVIDSVLDFDYASGRTDTRSADAVIDFIREHDVQLLSGKMRSSDPDDAHPIKK